MDVNEIIAMRMYGEGLDNDGQYWSEQDKKKLEDRFAEGVGITEIAMEFKRSEPAIVQMMIKKDLFRTETKSRNRSNRGLRCLCGKCLDSELCAHSPKNRGKNAVPGVCPKEDGTHV